MSGTLCNDLSTGSNWSPRTQALLLASPPVCCWVTFIKSLDSSSRRFNCKYLLWLIRARGLTDCVIVQPSDWSVAHNAGLWLVRRLSSLLSGQQEVQGSEVLVIDTALCYQNIRHMLKWSRHFLPEKIEKGLVCNWNIHYLFNFLHLNENWDRDKAKELWKLRCLKKWDSRPWIVFRNDICSPLVKISELLVGDLAIGDQHLLIETFQTIIKMFQQKCKLTG